MYGLVLPERPREPSPHGPDGGGAAARGGARPPGLRGSAVRGAVVQGCPLPARASGLRSLVGRPGHEEAARETGGAQWHRTHV
eukprot:12023652-Alexandrium_andersonii.AAC.1